MFYEIPCPSQISLQFFTSLVYVFPTVIIIFAVAPYFVLIEARIALSLCERKKTGSQLV